MVAARWCIVLVVALALAQGPAGADGAFAKGRGYARELAEPDQKALLFQEGGRETLILEVTYRGQVEEFGWVVPVPSRPRLSSVSADLFRELVRLTYPAPLSAKQGKGMRGGGGAGVTVIERAQVGPYDATVLAASDPRALAHWLQKHDYAFSTGSAQVLEPYVKQGWYYVALRIRVKKDLLTRLRRVDRGLKSLRDAPARIAGRIMQLADTQPAACAEKLQIVDRAARWAMAHPADPGGTAPGGDLSRQYRAYRAGLADLAQGRASDLDAREMLNCLPRCAGGPESETFQAAATRAGWSLPQSPTEAARAFFASVQRDLWSNVPYARSHAGRLQAALRAAKQGPKEMYYYFQVSYESVRKRLPAIRKLRGDPDSLPSPKTGTPISHYSLPVARALEVMERKIELHRATEEQVARAAAAADEALKGGTIAPLRLDFASQQLIYPLRISSLNPGVTKVQLYVLAPHRMATPGFETEFADRIGDLGRPQYRVLPDYVTGDRNYLTKLQADLSAREMTHDLIFARAPSDEAHYPAPREEQVDRPSPPGVVRRAAPFRARR